MRKIWFILRYEVVTLLTSKSFLFAAFGLPLIGALIFGVAGAISQNSQASNIASAIFSAPNQSKPDGYVDEAGWIKTIPTDVPPGALIAYPDEAAARRALDSGEIGAFFIVAKDYLQTGKLVYIRPDYNPLSSQGNSWLMLRLLNVNLLGGDAQLTERVMNPLNIEVKVTSTEVQRDSDNPLTFFLPYSVTLLFYIVILGASSLLLNSITREKENRVIEVLMSSVTPTQMLTGKIAGLGVAGLMQVIIWMGTSYTLLRLGGQTFNLPEAFQLPVSILGWGLVFFLLGYAVYASLMAGLGALVPNLKEASQATIVVILPMIIPLMFISVLIEDSNGLIAVALSLFPLTAPVAMMTRLAAGTVPWWQPTLAAILLALTAALIVRAVAGMFRAQTILSGQAFSIKRFFAALAGRS